MLSISLGGLGVGGGLPRWLVLILWGGEPKAAIARQLAQTRVVTRRGDRTASARQGLLAHAPVIGWDVAAVARRATEIVVARETVCAHERRWRAHLKCDERVALRSAVLLKAPCGEPDARADDRRSRGSERQELVAPTVVVRSNLMPVFALARVSSTSSAACARATNAASCAAEGAAGAPPGLAEATWRRRRRRQLDAGAATPPEAGPLRWETTLGAAAAAATSAFNSIL